MNTNYININKKNLVMIETKTKLLQLILINQTKVLSSIMITPNQNETFVTDNSFR